MSRGVVSTASIASSIGGSGGGGLFVLRGEIPSLKVTKALKSDPNESLLSFVETLFKKVVLLHPLHSCSTFLFWKYSRTFSGPFYLVF